MAGTRVARERREERERAALAVRPRVMTGEQVGRATVADLHALVARLCERTAGDPIATAAAMTVLLHALAGAGPGDAGDSTVAAVQATRRNAVLDALADQRLGLDAVSIADALGLTPVRISQVLSGPEAARRARAIRQAVAASTHTQPHEPAGTGAAA